MQKRVKESFSEYLHFTTSVGRCVLVWSCALVIGCANPTAKETDNPLFQDSLLKQEFRKNFFFCCIDYGYPGDACMDSILAEDVSIMGDFPLGRKGYEAADSLAREVRKEIVSDSIRLMTRRDYEIGKKRVFQLCLKYYSNGRADSVAAKVLGAQDRD